MISTIINKAKNRIHPNILLLGLTSLLNDISSEMIAPILPLLISQLGGTGLSIGLIGGLRENFGNILKMFFGFLSDKTKTRKAFIYTGYLNGAFVKFCLIFARSWQAIFLLTGLDRIGKGLRQAPRDALIAQSAGGKVGLGFGVHRTMDTLGAILGSVLVSILLWTWGLSFTAIIAIAAFLSFFSIIPLYWVQEEPIAKLKPTLEPLKFSFKNFSPAYKLFIVIASLFSLTNFSYMFFILRARDAFLGINPIIIPILLYVLFNICYTLCAMPLGILSDRIGRWKGITSGYLLFALTTCGFVFAHSISTFVPLFMMYGIALALIEVNQKSYISDVSSIHYKATALGTFDTATGISSFTGNIFAGFLWEYVSHQSIFAISCIISITTIILLFIFNTKLNGHDQSHPHY